MPVLLPIILTQLCSSCNQCCNGEIIHITVTAEVESVGVNTGRLVICQQLKLTEREFLLHINLNSDWNHIETALFDWDKLM